jgi:YD repeat-containing protein
LRQRLLTTAVDGLTTTYEYDALGQLKKATLSNGSWVGQDYDDARRLKAVYDDQGNRIDYELDRNGQRVGQTKKDPNGRLKVSLNRVMDALNRAQRTTGGEE